MFASGRVSYGSESVLITRSTGKLVGILPCIIMPTGRYWTIEDLLPLLSSAGLSSIAMPVGRDLLPLLSSAGLSDMGKPAGREDEEQLESGEKAVYDVLGVGGHSPSSPPDIV